MKETKRIFTMFSFYDRTGIVKFLEKQAQRGWLLEKMSAFGWKFRRIQPKVIHFSVNYFPSASAFDPEPSEKQETFREFCEHTGWRLAAQSAQIQIFYNDAADPVPIDTDPLVEVENIHRAMKKTLLPTYVMQICLGIFQILLLIAQLKNDPIVFFSTDANLFCVVCWVFALVLYGIDLGTYYSWRRRAKLAAENDGSFVETKGTRNFQVVSLVFMLAALSMMLMSFDSPWMSAVVFVTIAGIFLTTAVIVGISSLLKRLKATTKTNRSVTIILSVVLSLVLTGALVFGVVDAVMSDMEGEAPYETYEFRGHTYSIFRHALPLTVEDLADTDYDSFNYQILDDREGLLLKVFTARQNPKWGDLEEKDMEYSIIDVKAGLLFEACLDAAIHRYDGWHSEDIYGNIYQDSFVKIDPIPWGADQAYQLLQGGTSEYSSSYILCYGSRIVELNSDWDLTEAQMGVVGKILGE